MLDIKELFEAMEAMEFNMESDCENMEQFKEMSKINPTSLLQFRAIKIVYQCSSQCETIKGIFLYAGKLPRGSKEVLVFIAPYLKCCKIICSLCVIDLDKVVSVCTIP
jgi:hypothetical protein